MDFSNGPVLAALYPTLIWDDCPAYTVSLFQTGVVQPQLACTFSSANGWVPVLLNSNICVTGFPCGIFPKSNWVSSKARFSVLAEALLFAARYFTAVLLSFLLTLVSTACAFTLQVKESKQIIENSFFIIISINGFKDTKTPYKVANCGCVAGFLTFIIHYLYFCAYGYQSNR